MKIEMDQNTRATLTAACVAGAITCTAIAAFAWFWQWGVDFRATKVRIEEIRSNTCYREYKFSDVHQQNNVTVDYCPHKETTE